jgi:hypothetical protein
MPCSSGMTVEWRLIVYLACRVPPKYQRLFSDHGTQRRKLSKVYEMEMLVLTEMILTTCYDLHG